MKQKFIIVSKSKHPYYAGPFDSIDEALRWGREHLAMEHSVASIQTVGKEPPPTIEGTVINVKAWPHRRKAHGEYRK